MPRFRSAMGAMVQRNDATIRLDRRRQALAALAIEQATVDNKGFSKWY